MSSIILKTRETSQSFTYSLNDKQLGKGLCGKVWKATYMPSKEQSGIPMHRELAVKIFKPPFYGQLKLKAKIQFLQSLDPEYFIYPLANFSEEAEIVEIENATVKKVIVTVTPYFSGIDLIDCVEQYGSPVNLDERIRFVEKLCFLTNKIHDAGIIHGDIKPDNLLYDQKNQKLTFIDFDFSVSKNEENFLSSGTSNFMAPEVLYNFYVTEVFKHIHIGDRDRNQVVSNYLPTDEKTDIWSMLATLLAIFIGSNFFEKGDIDNFLANHRLTAVQLSNPHYLQEHCQQFFDDFQKAVYEKIESANQCGLISDDWKQFFLWALDVNAYQRPSIKEILRAINVLKRESELTTEEKMVCV